MDAGVGPAIVPSLSRVACALVVLLASACAGAGARRNLSNHHEACEPRYHEAPSDYACEYDTDCGFCHDGSDCGTVMSVQEIDRRGAACRQRDHAQCELSTARCCNGRCVTAGYAGD